MELTGHEQAVLAGVVARLKTEFGAEQVILYGSAARGDMDRESDIDLMAVLPAVDWDVEKRIGNIAFDAGLEIDRVISMTCVTRSDLCTGPLRASPLIHNINREGVPQ